MKPVGGAPYRFFCYAGYMKEAAYTYYLKKMESKPDAVDRIVNQVFDRDKIKNVHLVGICGKAMASLAGLLVGAGYNVTGSEADWNPPMSTVLEHLGITFKPFSIENLNNIDLLVMGNAYSPSNIEAQEARKKNIPQISSAQAFADFFIKGSKSIVIAGTHGKTTTSGLAAHIFIESQEKTNVLVGGVISNLGESYYYGGINAKYSVVEGDEYDTAYFDKAPKFLNYKPTIGVITSIEFDHADIYSDMGDYLAAFVFFAQEIPEEGYLLINDKIKPEYQKQLEVVCDSTILKYGFSENSDIRIVNNKTLPEKGGQSFDVSFSGKIYKDFFVPLFGLYNLENTASVVGIALNEGVSEEKIKKALNTFSGTELRQQIIYQNNRIVVIEDFAHHPTAVVCTIEGVRDHYPDKRLIAVFEPRSATSRRKDFEESYGVSFDKADIAIISKPPVKAVDDVDKMMDVERVVLKIKDRGVDAISFARTDDILNDLKEVIRPNDVVLIMSNGTFDNLPKRLVTWLSN